MSSVLARVELWINSIMAWMDAPIFGHGLGSFDWSYSQHRADHLAWMPTTILTTNTVSAGAAHNEYLHILVELGCVGLLLCALFVWLSVRRSASPAVWAVGVLAAISVIEFPLQNPATAVIAAVALGLTARLPRAEGAVR